MRKWTVVNKFYFGELNSPSISLDATTMAVGEILYESPLSEHNSIWVKNHWYATTFASTAWKANCFDGGDLTQGQADALWPPTTGGTSGYSGKSGFSGLGLSGYSGTVGINPMFRYNWSSTYTDSGAIYQDASYFYINEVDSGSNVCSAVWSRIKTGDLLQILDRQGVDHSIYVVAEDATLIANYYKFAFSQIAGVGSFAEADPVSVVWVHSGTSGYSGYSGVPDISTIEHDFWPAGAFIPATTGGAGLATFETSGQKVNVDVADYDTGATEEACYIWGRMTKWNGLTVKVKVHYVFTTINSGTTVQFEVAGRSYGDGDVLDQAMGTAQTCSDTLLDAGDVAVTAATAAITLGGTPDRSEIQCFRISRDTSADDGNPDARIIDIEIEYQKAATAETAW